MSHELQERSHKECCGTSLLVIQAEEVNGGRAIISVRGIAREVFGEGEDPVVVTVDGGVTHESGRADGVAAYQRERSQRDRQWCVSVWTIKGSAEVPLTGTP